MEDSKIKLSELVAPSFFELHRLIKEDAYTHYWLKGGRGSTKSSFISLEVIQGLIKDPQANAVCFRKVGDTLKDSVYAQVLWAIDALGMSDFFRVMLTPLRIIYKPTGQTIYFKGLDDANKTKSIKPRKGYFKYIWFEELEEFSGVEEIRKTTQSLLRGGNRYVVFYSYNPPRNTSSWVNKECAVLRPDKYVHHSTYLTVPREWLGEQFIVDAEYLKAFDEASYRHEYLGESVGNGANVFTNIVQRQIDDDEIKRFDAIRQGIDWGYATDPFVFLKMHYDRKHRRLYIFGELYKTGLLNDDAMVLIRQMFDPRQTIIADSEEPKSIAEFWRAGFNIRGAEKGKGSVAYGIKFLQRLEQIIIDPVRCPNTAREFTEYEFIREKDGTLRDDYPDKNNHAIDTTRYALEFDMDKRGLF
jgi:PBSX family phage terminase large subunit